MGGFISFFFFSPALGAGYTEVFHTGKIDWATGAAEATGTTILLPKDAKSEKARAASAEEALKSARANLFDLVGRIKVDSLTRIKDLLQESEPLQARIRDLVEKVPAQKVRFSSNGRVETTLTMLIPGPLAELVLPQSICPIDSVQSKNSNHNSEKELYTGLVVVCLGIRIGPAMFPTIFDEDGQLVYGAPFIHRAHAVKRGVAAYSRDIAAGERDERVAPRPLIVKAIKAAASGPSDIVISNSDAAKVRGSAHNLKLLQTCRVIIIME